MLKRECRRKRRSNSSESSGSSDCSSRHGRFPSRSSSSSSRSSICSLPKNSHYRIAVMGAAGVGKTSIVSRFLFDRFQSTYKPTVEEQYRVENELIGNSLTLDILDTSGSFQFPAMRELAIKTSDAFALVYSIGDENSFEELRRFREEILELRPDEIVPIVVVGNKLDLTSNESALFRKVVDAIVSIDWGNGHVESSAKDGNSIFPIFDELLTQLHLQVSRSPIIYRQMCTSSLSNGRTRNSRSRSGKSNSCGVS